ncbi:MAG TPA: cation:proton antiporter, partial [Rhizomicrobium sp.]|nr:cation:proton antiporter [Rhizomicrobium sp.]
MTSAEATETAREPQSEPRGSYLPYVWLVLAVGAMAVISNRWGGDILHGLAGLEDAPSAPVLGAIVLFSFCSFASFYATWRTPLPSFVVSIALGMAGHKLFAPIVADPTLLASMVTGSAAIILFGGGLEMPLRNFMRLFFKIALLAIPGVLVTGFCLSLVIGAAAALLGFKVAPAAVILLGAILASTDPAAIIPVLEHVRFRRRDPKDIVIAESALNDVVGTLLTSVFFKLSLATATLTMAYQSLASGETAQFLARQAGFGAVFGLVGFVLLWLLSRMKKGHDADFGADHVNFIVTPILAFLGASILGASGF